MTVFSGGGYTGEGYHSALNLPKADSARITLLLLPGKRPSLICLSKFSRKKTRHVIKTPRLALGNS